MPQFDDQLGKICVSERIEKQESLGMAHRYIRVDFDDAAAHAEMGNVDVETQPCSEALM